jgi:hypothetical protein
MEQMISTGSVPGCYKQDQLAVVASARVEAGSNTSTVVLRIVGDDE